MHRVRVNQAGFGYQGETYPTLSAIARKITGTQRSGPEFFAYPRKVHPPKRKPATE